MGRGNLSNYTFCLLKIIQFVECVMIQNLYVTKILNILEYCSTMFIFTWFALCFFQLVGMITRYNLTHEYMEHCLEKLANI